MPCGTSMGTGSQGCFKHFLTWTIHVVHPCCHVTITHSAFLQLASLVPNCSLWPGPASLYPKAGQMLEPQVFNRTHCCCPPPMHLPCHQSLCFSLSIYLQMSQCPCSQLSHFDGELQDASGTQTRHCWWLQPKCYQLYIPVRAVGGRA